MHLHGLILQHQLQIESLYPNRMQKIEVCAQESVQCGFSGLEKIEKLKPIIQIDLQKFSAQLVKLLKTEIVQA